MTHILPPILTHCKDFSGSSPADQSYRGPEFALTEYRRLPFSNRLEFALEYGRGDLANTLAARTCSDLIGVGEKYLDAIDPSTTIRIVDYADYSERREKMVWSRILKPLTIENRTRFRVDDTDDVEFLGDDILVSALNKGDLQDELSQILIHMLPSLKVHPRAFKGFDKYQQLSYLGL